MYTRENPSSRYKELIGLYKQLHIEGEKNLGIPPENTFPGFSILPHIERIKNLITKSGADTILDYGCGKGEQYKAPIVEYKDGTKEWLVDYWDVTGVTCYDPCYLEHSQIPQDTFDGVISTDMLEHCSEEDIPWIIEELFSFSKGFVYANVACYPAKKKLPNGENAHCTIKPVDWWKDHFERIGVKNPTTIWKVVLTYIETDSETGSQSLKEFLLEG